MTLDFELNQRHDLAHPRTTSSDPCCGGEGRQLSDVTAHRLTNNAGTLSTDATEEWKGVDVTALVQADVTAWRKSSESRLRFETPSDTDGITDAVLVRDGGDSRSSGFIPELVVNYRAPRP